jgi:hypothetical protein
MTNVYTDAVKIARMAAWISAIGTTGVLEICTAGFGAVLATLSLNNPAAPAPSGAGVATLAGFPKTDASADNSGKALRARIRTATGGTTLNEFDVGLTAAAAPARVASTAVPLGAYRTNGSEIYKCVAAGSTSAGAGPSGTAAGIADGTVTWDWYCKANADLQLDSLEITLNQPVTVSAAVFTHAP